MDFHPVQGALLVTNDALQGAFAVAGPDGLRPVPELSRGVRMTEHSQRVERVIGSYPGTLWLQTFDAVPDPHPDNPSMISRLFRHDGGAWKPVGDPRSKDFLWAGWTSGPGCLVGARGPYAGRAARAALDCPGRKVPVRPFPDPGAEWRVEQGRPSPAGDVVLLERSYDKPWEFHLVVMTAADPPEVATRSIPFPDVVRERKADVLQDHRRSLIVLSPTDVYLPLALAAKPGTNGAGAAEPMLLHFDGKSFARVDLPALEGGVPVLALAPDGALLLAGRRATRAGEDFTVWRRAPGQPFQVVGDYRSPAGEGHWNAYDLWAGANGDLWIGAVRVGDEQAQPRSRVLHAGPVREVWKPPAAP
ncbi:MAG: hypothetical protein QM820_60650 [Minicystis sp.]